MKQGMRLQKRAWIWAFGAAALMMAGGAGPAMAHCDTLDGPVVQDARRALEKGRVAPVLKWIRPEDEHEIQAAFQKTLNVRAQSAEAQELADRYFFETLVRVHRAGEGAPFTGLKPAGTEVEPGVAAADRAMEQGSPDAVVELITRAVAQGIRERYEKAAAAKAHKDESAAAGREFVAAYVNFMHYVEGIHALASGASTPHDEKDEASAAPSQAPGHEAMHNGAQPAHAAGCGHEVKALETGDPAKRHAHE